MRRILRRPRESDAVERPVVEHARRRGWIALKLESRAYTGFPDRAFFLPGGIVVLIEFKRPGGARSALQVERGAHLEALGHAVYVFDDALDAIDHLEAAAEDCQTLRSRSERRCAARSTEKRQDR